MKVVLLGSGNVSTHLGNALKTSGHEILQVWSRNLNNARELALKLNTTATDSYTAITSAAELYIISVSDDAISAIADNLQVKNKIAIHTSGTTGMEVLEKASDRIGVFYPLQTFSKAKPVDFITIPISVEGNTEEVKNILLKLGNQLSNKVIEMDSVQRRTLHVAAVIAGNFSNHLFTLAKQLLNNHQLDFDLIRPLIAETAAKIQTINPLEAQTGPAVRNDKKTIEKHLELLQNDFKLKQFYQLFTESIITTHNSP